MEDEDQNMHLKNLSVHAAQNEEEALNLLFLGDTNRMIAEVYGLLVRLLGQI
jgi:kinesin family protein 6/9